MLVYEEGSKLLLAASLTSCGGTKSNFYWLVKKLVGEEELLPKEEHAIKILLKIDEDVVTVGAILEKFGTPEHFRDMKGQADEGFRSVAWEAPDDIRPVLHTFLPITDGVYENEGVKIALSGLVPLGPQSGFLVAHLGAVFSCPCQGTELERLMKRQSEDVQFMEFAGKVQSFDYGETELRRNTLKAKEELGL